MPDDDAEMITLFHATGGYTYIDQDGKPTGYKDVFTKFDFCLRHYEQIGLGADYVERFIR